MAQKIQLKRSNTTYTSLALAKTALTNLASNMSDGEIAVARYTENSVKKSLIGVYHTSPSAGLTFYYSSESDLSATKFNNEKIQSSIPSGTGDLHTLYIYQHDGINEAYIYDGTNWLKLAGSGSGTMLVKEIDATSSGKTVPTKRPDNTPLVDGDYIIPSSSATLPLTVYKTDGTTALFTFTSAGDKAVFNDASANDWILQPGGGIVGVLVNNGAAPQTDRQAKITISNTDSLITINNATAGTVGLNLNKVTAIPVTGSATDTTVPTAKAVRDAINALDNTNGVTTASLDTSTNVVTLTGNIKETDGIIAKGSASDVPLAPVAKTGKAEDVSFTLVYGKITSTTVQNAITEVWDDSKLTVSTSTPSSGDILKKYTFTQNGATVATIDIPKDYLVRSGSVGTVTTADKASGGKFYGNDDFQVGDKYIDLIINTHDTNAEEHIYINVKDLADAYTGSTGTMVNVSISDANAIGATINDGSITKAKLASAVQTSLGKADSSIQGVTSTGDTYVSATTTTPSTGNRAITIAADVVTTSSALGSVTATGQLADAYAIKSYVDTKVAGSVTSVKSGNGYITPTTPATGAATLTAQVSTSISSETANGKLADAYAVKQYVASNGISATLTNTAGKVTTKITQTNAKVALTTETYLTTDYVKISKVTDATTGAISYKLVNGGGTTLGDEINVIDCGTF